MNKLKKALFSCALLFLFSIAMLAGTTYAWFNENVVIEETQIIMGHLDVKVELNDPDEGDGEQWYTLGNDEQYNTTGIFETVRNEPGSTATRRVKVSNVGTIPLAFRVNTNILETSGMKNYVDFIVTYDDINYQVHNGPIFDTTPFLALQPGESATFTVTYVISTELGNWAENANYNVKVVIQAEQLARAAQLGTVYDI